MMTKYFINANISIHALREEGDTAGSSKSPKTGYFYPRPPRGGRPQRLRPRLPKQKFLSTPSARRATCVVRVTAACEDDFYPRPPRGGRREGFRTPAP